MHPTGTGKSFIGFKLCEDNSDKTICWLSPSRYIYQTQIENLAEVSDNYNTENIKFYTYAKLILLSDEEISEIQPKIIILDEFHRCGAELWGQGVQKLLKAYTDAQILGLSATAIRYLNNQRDMTDELFDGNIASEMTLGEAIVRDILSPPKYILSIFSYQKDLEKYEKRVHSAKSKAVKDASTAYLESLRCALDKAEKLDVLFDKHMTDRNGKYIVFCANLEHMQDMIDKAKELFCKVDSIRSVMIFKVCFYKFDHNISNNRLIATLLQKCKSQDRICVHFSLDFYIFVDIMTKAVVGEFCLKSAFTQFKIKTHSIDNRISILFILVIPRRANLSPILRRITVSI